MSIVCGTDYSARAAEAGTVAALLAARLQEPLILLHALDERADFRVDAEAARAYESVFEIGNSAAAHAYALVANGGAVPSRTRRAASPM